MKQILIWTLNYLTKMGRQPFDFLLSVFVMIALVHLPFASQSQGLQDIRKGLQGAKREVSKTNRDVNQVKKLFSQKKRTVDPATDTSSTINWSMQPYVPNSGMIKDYEFIYTFLHKKQEYSFKKDSDLISLEYDSIHHEFYKNIGEGQKLKDGVEVIGWHPYWEGENYKNYNFKMLSIISYYSYDINAGTGSPNNQEVIDQLLQSSLPDSALKYGVKLYLSVTSFGAEANKRFLRDPVTRELFIDEVMDILQTNTSVFGGVDLNFEEISAEDKEYFTKFVKELNVRLSDFGFEIILDVPYFNHNNIIDYYALSGSVKYFNIMGYDFSGEHSIYPGSISPLHGLVNQPSLESAVHDFLNLNISPQKLILSLPLYGVSWDISDISKGLTADYKESLPYYKIKAQFSSEYYPFYDPLSASFFYMKEDDDEDSAKIVCWFENETSLDLKMSWAADMQLKGIGLWALGYENGAPEIWQTIQKNYGQTLVPIEPSETKLSGPYGLAKTVIAHQKQIGFGFLIFVAFVLMGFLYSLRDWRVREILFQSQFFRVAYSIFILVLAIYGIQWWWNGNAEWKLVIGMLIGAAIVAMVNWLFTKYRNDLK
ncbi:MAG: glycosyl hydrolase family 18 protein, partial [Salibacteraceae bacterium]|jgi:spore germination protein YaaH|nr:glycosyl hydrolase family 18 protein [Salibacteraceae bacterium]